MASLWDYDFQWQMDVFQRTELWKKWSFLNLKPFLKSEGLDQKEEEYDRGVKVADMVRVKTKSKDGFTEEKTF